MNQTLDEIALRFLLASVKSDNLRDFDEKKMRQAFKVAKLFETVSADATSSPEPEWVSERP